MEWKGRNISFQTKPNISVIYNNRFLGIEWESKSHGPMQNNKYETGNSPCQKLHSSANQTQKSLKHRDKKENGDFSIWHVAFFCYSLFYKRKKRLQQQHTRAIIILLLFTTMFLVNKVWCYCFTNILIYYINLRSKANRKTSAELSSCRDGKDGINKTTAPEKLSVCNKNRKSIKIQVLSSQKILFWHKINVEENNFEKRN